MRVTTEVMNQNKDKVKIRVDIYCHYSTITYKISLKIAPYGKQESFSLESVLRDDYIFTLVNENRRNGYAKEKVLEYITEDQLQLAINNAHKALKPTAENIKFW